MSIDALPTPPSRSDAANFAARADAFLTALPTFGSQANDLATAVNGNATAAQTAATTAINAPGTSATSATSLTVGTGAQALTIQTGKNFVVGMSVTIARTAAPTTWMVGQITAHNPGTGALTVSVGLANGAGTFTGWTVSLSAPVNFPAASAAQVWAGASNAVALTPLALLAASAPVALVDAATVALDLSTGMNFTVTLGGNRSLGNPANLQPGQAGLIVLTQDGTGSRTLAFGSFYLFPGGAPTLSTAAGAIDVISYFVLSSTKVLCTLSRFFS